MTDETPRPTTSGAPGSPYAPEGPLTPAGPPTPPVAAPPAQPQPAPPAPPAPWQQQAMPWQQHVEAPPAAPPDPDLRSSLAAVRGEVAKAVVGQDAAVTGLIIALLCRGHVLLEGVPGVAKTLLVRALSGALQLGTKRVQFTPDLMPGDVTGSLVYDARTAQFSFREGPVFTNLLLADEINRTPPKTQASLLEAMEERQVTLEGQTHPLPPHFFVVATQNPLELEGTYPLPEAQLDRFLMRVRVGYPDADSEQRMLAAFHARGGQSPTLSGLLDGPSLPALQDAAARLACEDSVIAYVVNLVRFTREDPRVVLGASPRAAQGLLAAAKARAALEGQHFVTPDHVKAVSGAVLEHRLVLRGEAEVEGIRPADVLAHALESVQVPR